ncbi:MAG: leucine-rich repeat protein [Clostridiales bacterium]|nr:leucine-rich repeat protein [Clostridiales bacterium]
MRIKQLLSGLMTAAMVFTLVPSTALAADSDAQSVTVSVITGTETVDETTTNVTADYSYSYTTTATDGYTQIGDTGVYYAADDDASSDVLSTTLVARRNVTWDTLYQDVAGLDDAGFDVITTATTSSAVSGTSWNAYAYTQDSNGDGEDDQTIIEGSKVPTQVSAQTYVEDVILAAAGVAAEDSTEAEVAALEQPAATDSGMTWAKSNLYYTLSDTGFTINLPATIETTPSEATISDSTNWGDYLVTVTDADGNHYVKTGRTDTTAYDPTSTDEEILAGYQLGNTTMYAATFETSDGSVYTMGYLENMWSASYEFSFRIAADTSMTGMDDSTNYEQFADIQGKTITKLTYYGAYGVYEYDLSDYDLKVRTKQTASITGDTEVTVLEGNDAVINVDLSALTSGDTYELTSVSAGSGRNATAVDASNYSYDATAGTVTINADALESNSYSLTFTDSNGEYASASFSVTITVEEPQSVTISVVTDTDTVDYTYKYTTTDTEGYTQIGETGVYYVADRDAISPETIYTTGTFSNEDYYDGLSDGKFDVVTTATTSKGSRFANADYVIDEEAGTTTFQGVKNVPVQVDSTLYVEAQILEAADAVPESGVYAVAAALDDTASTLLNTAYYKVLGSDGTYTTVVDTSSTYYSSSSEYEAEIVTTTPWGDYLVEILNADGTTASLDVSSSTVQGLTFTTSDGYVYSTAFLENIWFQAYEFSFMVSEDSVQTANGHTPGNYAQFADIQGKTITSATYYCTDGVYTYDLGELFVKYQQDGVATGDETVNATVDSTATVNIDISALAGDGWTLSSIEVENIGYHGTTYDAAAYGATYENGVLTLNPSTGTEGLALYAGAHTVVFTNDTYADVSFEFTIVLNTEALENAIAQANALSKSNYTEATWTNLETALTAAQTMLESPTTQAEVNDAASALQTAISSLVKKTTSSGSSTTKTALKVGATFTVSNVKYKVTGSNTVQYVKNTSKKTSVTIPASVTKNGVKYKVTSIAKKAFKGNTKLKKVVIPSSVKSIGKKAFFGCKNLKTITIKTTKLTKKSVGAKAFKGINAKATIKVPKKKLAAYKKILKAKGVGSKVTIKKK